MIWVAEPGDQRPRVLHVITTLGRGGAEAMLCRLLMAGRDGPHLQAAMALRDGATRMPALQAAGVRACSLEMPGLRLPGPGLLRRFRARVRAFNPDLIIGWLYHGNLAALGAARLAPKRPPVVFNLRNTLYDLHQEPLTTRWAIRLGAGFSRRVPAIIHNARLSVEHHARVGYPKEPAVVIPNGIDGARFVPDSAARLALRRELGLADDALLVGLISRVHPMKDHRGFFAAAQQLLAAGQDVHFILAGYRVSAQHPLLREELAASGAAAARFHLLGERDDMPRLNAALDIALSTSAWGEGFANAVLEAAACGVPCVVTDVGESATIVAEGGRVVPPGDPTALADAVLELLRLDPEQRRQLGLRGREGVLARYSLATVVERYEALYREILAARH